ncbi:DnaJ domain containing protein [Trichomonas vaginalis G3]|uniref:DnaJ domain containing protein n=1 Tax=Trichomonas vaginalis (strain ATCC PRA-98 / G3) TaxID=412133 RepID=A2EYL6_TRIV3|nr:positive regulation of translation initiation in response to endoplasmic reticulum stress [Trichomonas vaginalis G3]EAY02229.1 DnaJ domain containing protein [Trichomonas vaginalis G3]KAI5507302.1 positive regulation of translation initiation in response to endoplasmic reticulum stress [Trichomonas vaginalis G3]|eukprot:XP_001314567.1 DnaJ domain containing protein [Trichomonas vaginalis G3]
MFVFLNYLCYCDVNLLEKARKLVAEHKWFTGKDTTTDLINQVGILDADPELFFLRAQCYFGLDQFKEAVEDLSKALTSTKFDKANMPAAYEIRYQCHLRLGNIDDAEYDASKLSSPDPLIKVRSYKDTLQEIEQYKKKGKYDEALLNYKEILKSCDKAVNLMVEASETALMADDLDYFNEISSQAIQLDSSNLKLLELRGKFFLCENDYDFAKRHFITCAQRAIQASKCPSLNRQNNELKTAYDKFEVAANNSRVEDAYLFSNKAFVIAERNCKNNSKAYLKALSLKTKALVVDNKVSEALEFVNNNLKNYPNSTDLLLEKGDILIKMKDLDEANKCFQQVQQREKNNKRAEKAINDIYDQREKEKKCDYYELLNLSRDCTRTQVRDAVRRAVRKYHPDQYSDPIKKKEMEKIMQHVNRANEILSDPQKKALYDRGEDPDNPGYRPPPEGQQSEQQFFNMGNGQFFTFNGGGFNMGGGRGFKIIFH